MILKLIAAVLVASVAYFSPVMFRNVVEHYETYNNIYQYDKVRRLSSSAWCSYDKTSGKLCTFKNIFYVPDSDTFVFILNNESIISGFNSRDDFKTINLSSIGKHNYLFLKLQIIVGYEHHFKDNHVFINEPIFLMSRFKSDNIMHVIHDDLLPLFSTYEFLCSGDILHCVRNTRLVFADSAAYLNHIEWYNFFSNKNPYSLKDLKVVTCFEKIFVGLTRDTLWFQYGFGIPQGPLLTSQIDSVTINRFTSFILDNFKINELHSDILHVVLLSRKLNRRIINERFVTNTIVEVCTTIYPEYINRIKIHVVDLSQNKSIDIISVVVKSNLFVGMHGSAMIFPLFLPNNAAIVELFPFGIQPQHVSSTRALTQLPGVFYNYLSWRNFKEIHSVGHPEWPPLLGGIHHLLKEEQEQILKVKEVPAVECCHNPMYLYRMFQDTIVDENFSVILKQVLTNQKERLKTNQVTFLNDYLKDKWFSPGFVSNISCNFVKTIGAVIILWNKPYNLQTMEPENPILYYITVEIISRVITIETFSHSVSVKLSNEEKQNLNLKVNGIQIWVRVVLENLEGHDVHSYCTI